MSLIHINPQLFQLLHSVIVQYVCIPGAEHLSSFTYLSQNGCLGNLFNVCGSKWVNSLINPIYHPRVLAKDALFSFQILLSHVLVVPSSVCHFDNLPLRVVLQILHRSLHLFSHGFYRLIVEWIHVLHVLPARTGFQWLIVAIDMAFTANNWFSVFACFMYDCIYSLVIQC